MEFNERLRELRQQRNMTQEDLANKIFVSRTLVSKWESGARYPSDENLDNLAELFGVDKNVLVESDEEKKKNKIYSVLSSIYTWICCFGAGWFFAMFVSYIISYLGRDEIQYNFFMGMIHLYLTPVIAAMIAIEVLLLNKKRGNKTAEASSLLALVLCWIVPLFFYIFIF